MSKKVLPEYHLSQSTYKSKKLSPFLNIKDQTKSDYINDLTNLLKFPEKLCSEICLDKTSERIN